MPPTSKVGVNKVWDSVDYERQVELGHREQE